MFQDYENIPEALFSESWLSEKYFELQDAIEKLSETEQEALFRMVQPPQQRFERRRCGRAYFFFLGRFSGSVYRRGRLRL